MRFARIYLIPGAVIQSVMVGGGYGTGRELIEFFTQHGPWEGLVGLIVATAIMSGISALTFEYARRHQVYDYRAFFKKLIGRGWILFEIGAIALFLLILAILGAAAGEIMEDYIGIPVLWGSALIYGLVILFVFYGRDIITRVLAFWSVFLYLVFIALFIAAWAGFPGPQAHDPTAYASDGWISDAISYPLYNVILAPIVLFAIRPIETGKQAIGAGVIAGLIAMIPAFLFHLLFSGIGPEIIHQSMPSYWLINRIAVPGFALVFTVMLAGTFVETGMGIIQGFNERIDTVRAEAGKPPAPAQVHAAIAVAMLALSYLLSKAGIIDLIAKGYGYISWYFGAVYVLPLLLAFLLRRA